MSAVERDAPAQRAGLKAGDVITAIDNATLVSAEDVVRRVSEAHPGSQLTLTISRDGASQTLQVVVDELALEAEPLAAAAPPATPGDAERAGLKRGDVVQQVNRQVVRNAADVTGALAAVGQGRSVFVLVWRAGDNVLLQMRD